MTAWEIDPTNPEPRNGDRVKVGDLELTNLRCNYTSPHCFGSGLCAGWPVVVPRGVPVHVMREVGPVEDWQPGDVVRDAEGVTYIRTSDSNAVWADFSDDWWRDDYPTRPLTRLIPAPKRDVEGMVLAFRAVGPWSYEDLANAAYEFLGIKP